MNIDVNFTYIHHHCDLSSHSMQVHIHIADEMKWSVSSPLLSSSFIPSGPLWTEWILYCTVLYCIGHLPVSHSPSKHRKTEGRCIRTKLGTPGTYRLNLLAYIIAKNITYISLWSDESRGERFNTTIPTIKSKCQKFKM